VGENTNIEVTGAYDVNDTIVEKIVLVITILNTYIYKVQTRLANSLGDRPGTGKPW